MDYVRPETMTPIPKLRRDRGGLALAGLRRFWAQPLTPNPERPPKKAITETFPSLLGRFRFSGVFGFGPPPPVKSLRALIG